MFGDKKIIDDIRTRYLDAKRFDQTDIDQLKANKNTHQRALVDQFVASLKDDQISLEESRSLRHLGVSARQWESFDFAWTDWADKRLTNRTISPKDMCQVFGQTDIINTSETSWKIFSNWNCYSDPKFSTKKAVITHLANQCVAHATTDPKGKMLIAMLVNVLDRYFLYDLTDTENRELGLLVVKALAQIPTKSATENLLKMTNFTFDPTYAVNATAARALFKRDHSYAAQLLQQNASPAQCTGTLIALSQDSVLPTEVPFLLTIINDATGFSQEMRGYAALALGQLSQDTPQPTRREVTENLILFLTDAGDHQAVQALQALGKLAEESDIDVLSYYFLYNNADVQIAAIDACASIQQRSSNANVTQRQLIIKQLRTVALTTATSVTARQHALTALVREYQITATQTLLTCLQDKNSQMQYCARENLLQLAQSTLQQYAEALQATPNRTKHHGNNLYRLEQNCKSKLDELKKIRRPTDSQTYAKEALQEVILVLNGKTLAAAADL